MRTRLAYHASISQFYRALRLVVCLLTCFCLPILAHAAPNVTLTSPVGSTTRNLPTFVTVSATASDPASEILSVEFRVVYQGVDYPLLFGFSQGSGVYTGSFSLPTTIYTGTYTVYALARSASGASARSNSANVTFVNIYPAISLVSPASSSQTVTQPYLLNLQAIATSASSGIRAVEYHVITSQYGDLPFATIPTQPDDVYRFSIPLTTLPEGRYGLYALAIDNAGRTIGSELKYVTVVNDLPPHISLQQPSTDLIVNQPYRLHLEATAGSTDPDPQGAISVVDFHVVTAALGDRIFTSVNSDSNGVYAYDVLLSGLTPGVYQIYASTTDSLGRTVKTPIRNIRVNHAAPTIAFNEPATGLTVNEPYALHLAATASSSDGNILGVEYHVVTPGNDDLAFTTVSAATQGSYNFDVNLSTLAPGVYQLYAVAIDEQGNRTSSPARKLVVNASPTITLTQPATDITQTRDIPLHLEATANDADGSIKTVDYHVVTTDGTDAPFLSLTQAVNGVYAADIPLTGLPEGRYGVYALATDDRGGQSISVARTVTLVDAAPVITLSKPAGNITLIQPNVLHMEAIASDADDGLLGVEFHVLTPINGDFTMSTVTQAVKGVYTFDIPVETLPAGYYKVYAVAVDKQGKRTPSDQRGIDISAPSLAVKLLQPSQTLTVSQPYTLHVKASVYDPVGKVPGVDFHLIGPDKQDKVFATATQAIDGVYSADVNIPTGVPQGDYQVYASASDDTGHSSKSTPPQFVRLVSAGLPIIQVQGGVVPKPSPGSSAQQDGVSFKVFSVDPPYAQNQTIALQATVACTGSDNCCPRYDAFSFHLKSTRTNQDYVVGLSGIRGAGVDACVFELDGVALSSLPADDYRVYAQSTDNKGQLVSSCLDCSTLRIIPPPTGALVGYAEILSDGSSNYIQGWACQRSESAASANGLAKISYTVQMGDSALRSDPPQRIDADGSTLLMPDPNFAQEAAVCNDSGKHGYRIDLTQYAGGSTTVIIAQQIAPSTGTLPAVALPCANISGDCRLAPGLVIAIAYPKPGDNIYHTSASSGLADVYVQASIGAVNSNLSLASTATIVDLHVDALDASGTQTIQTYGARGANEVSSSLGGNLALYSNKDRNSFKLPVGRYQASATVTFGAQGNFSRLTSLTAPFTVEGDVSSATLLPISSANTVYCQKDTLTIVPGATQPRFNYVYVKVGDDPTNIQLLYMDRALLSLPDPPFSIPLTGNLYSGGKFSPYTVPAGNYHFYVLGSTVAIADPLQYATLGALQNPAVLPSGSLAGRVIDITVKDCTTTVVVDSSKPLDPDDLLPQGGQRADSLPGTFEVTPNGAASYTIPLSLPTGPGGIHPSLSLSYSSQGGYGPLGIGWSLSGLSAITRCPRAPRYDGVPAIESVHFDDNDRYCLDGQRLIAVKTDGVRTEYRTAIESFSKIIAYGDAHTGAGPQYFKVWTKPGLVMTYGCSQEARVALPPAQPSSTLKNGGWLLIPPRDTTPRDGNKNRISGGDATTGDGCAPIDATTKTLAWERSSLLDVSNNAIYYHYLTFPAGGESYLSEIDYGTTRVVLQYGSETEIGPDKVRADRSVSYLAGSLLYSSKLLRSVEIKEQTSTAGVYTTLWRYDLDYQQYPQRRTLLQKVTQSAPKPGGALSSMPPTVINWKQVPADVTTLNGILGGWKMNWVGNAVVKANIGHGDIRAVDFNNDGISDLLVYDPESYRIKVCLNNRQGLPTSYSGGSFNCNDMISFPGAPAPIGGPLNNTNRLLKDFIFDNATLVNGDATQRIPQYYPDWMFVLDLKGDGHSEVAFASPSQVDGQPTLWAVCQPSSAGAPFDCTPIAKRSEGGVDTAQQPYTGTIPGPRYFQSRGKPVEQFKVGNFLGHGKTGIAVYDHNDPTDSNKGTWAVYEYDAASRQFAAPVYLSGGPNGDNVDNLKRIYIGDFDGDGRSDFLFWRHGHPRLGLSKGAPQQAFTDWQICYSRDDGANQFLLDCHDIQLPDLSGPPAFVPQPETNITFGDFNGDGKLDFATRYVRDGVYEEWGVCLATGLGFDCQPSPLIVPLTPNADLFGRGGGRTVLSFDITGDGLADLFGPVDDNTRSLDKGIWRYCPISDAGLLLAPARLKSTYLEDGDGVTLNCQQFHTHGGGAAFNVFGDFNGSGKVSMLGFYPSVIDGPDGKPDHPSDDNGINGRVWDVRVPTFEQRDVIDTIENGLGAKTTINYRRITESDVYTPAAPDASLPSSTYDMVGPMSVVSEVVALDGLGGTARSTYHYSGLRQDRYDGMLGFARTTLTDANTGIRIDTDFRQDWPYIGMMRQRTTTLANGVATKLETVDYANLEGRTALTAGSSVVGFRSPYVTVFPYTRTSIASGYDPSTGVLLSSMTTSSKYDAETQASACGKSSNCGNPTRITITTSGDNDSHSVVTDSHYNNLITDTLTGTLWQLARLSNVLVTHDAVEDKQARPTIIRESAFTYRSDGLLETETIEPAKPQYTRTTTHGYDAYGNGISVTVSGGASLADGTDTRFDTRTSSIGYDNQGRYPASKTNALLQPESYTYNAGFGTVATLTGPNQLTTHWVYDEFGRKDSEETETDLTDPLNATSTRHTIKSRTLTWFCSGNGHPAPTRNSKAPAPDSGDPSQDGYAPHCPDLAVYFTVSASTGGGIGYAYYDVLGRQIRSQSVGFDGRAIFMDTQYDNRGHIAHKTRPYFPGEAIHTIDFTYDDTGRVIQTVRDAPEGKGAKVIDTVSYNGLITTTTASKDRVHTQTRVEEKYASGKTRRVVDHIGKQLSYDYDATGNLLAVHKPGEPDTITSYDPQGRKISHSDPDSGTWTYTYNALDQLKTQTSPNQAKIGTRTSLVYDLLGRLIQRQEPDLLSTWDYDRYPKDPKQPAVCAWIGALCHAGAGNDFSRTLHYDSAGRPDSVTNFIDKAYITATGYDLASRLATVTFPNQVKIRNLYTARGHQQALLRLGSDGNVAEEIWRAATVDASGRTRRESYGNGITTDTGYNPDGDQLASLVAGRLVANSGANGGQISNQNFQIDSLGLLTARSDTANVNPADNSYLNEAYGYDSLNRLIQVSGSSTQSISYADNGNILSKSGVGTYHYGERKNTHLHQLTSVSDGQNSSYDYDLNGNLVTGNSRGYTWTDADQVKHITDSSRGHDIDFLYDMDRTRVTETDTGGGKTRITYTINPRLDLGHGYQRIIEDATATQKVYTEKVYLSVGGRNIAVISTQNNGNPDTQWMHHDHLGSVIAVTDGQGNVIARYRYDAWGRQARLVGAKDPTRRGFTGHEELDSIGLVNMNGRLYDPLLGRMLSVDPQVQDPWNLQNYNGYSYVLNNPLMLTDPSGYSNLSNFVTGNWVVMEVLSRVSYDVGGILVGIGSAFCGPAIAACAAVGTYDNERAHGAQPGDAIAGGIMAGGFAELSYGVGEATRGDGLFNGANVIGSPDFYINIGAHAVLGAMQSGASGGDLKSGFISAGVSAAAAPYISGIGGGKGDFQYVAARIAAAAILGGTAAEIVGGKFANGAVAAAFERAFNAEGDHGDNAADICKGSFQCYRDMVAAAEANGTLKGPSMDGVLKDLGILNLQAAAAAGFGPAWNALKGLLPEAAAEYPVLGSVGANANKLYNELARLGNKAATSSGREASQLLQKMAQRAGLEVESGGNHLNVINSNGDKITQIPHSVNSGYTAKGIVRAIMREAGF